MIKVSSKKKLKPGIVYSDKYCVDIGAHVFPVEKYKMVRNSLIKEKYIRPVDIIKSKPSSMKQMSLVHTPEYLDDLLNLKNTHRTMFSELPLTREIVDAHILAAGGTIQACRLAVQCGIGIHIGGGFHHAFSDRAEGFCYINDFAVGIRVLQSEKKIRRAFVVDCDLHQGNGTARIFEEDPTVFTFSIHQERNYPVKQKSDIDIGLKDYVGDDEYLRELGKVIPIEIKKFKPDLVVYVAGADPFEQDQLGGLRLSKRGLKKRDEMVIKSCLKLEIPVVIVLAGGYAQDTRDTVDIHTHTCVTAIELLSKQN